ncbi:MAG: hypothetical protein ACYS0E_09690 [Planctomycetota bacterium]|jgi:alkanesulfonate monooxygenase SsuD/methylene tetrahydromethanopterin reductase-like flavin-dependent oxidoreductase (luciferase family)
MDERNQYVEKMQAAMGQLEVKASLAKMELGGKKDELIGEYDQLTDRLRRIKEDTGEQFDALASGFEEGWKAFRTRYDEVMKKFREP